MSPKAHLRQHPAYEPRSKALVCPFCDTFLQTITFTRVTEFENHLEGKHAAKMTAAEAETWLSATGYAQWRNRQAQSR